MSLLKRVAKSIAIFFACLASFAITAAFLMFLPTWFFVAVAIGGLVFWIYLSEKY